VSALNGDKSTYHRKRKQRIARRQRTRELLKRATAEPKSVGSFSPRQVTVGVRMSTPLLALQALRAHSRCRQKEARAADRHLECEA
jgi:hypothetical protein